jgi:hypothetical protein
MSYFTGLVTISPSLSGQKGFVTVFITQQNLYIENIGTAYDQQNTYCITPALLDQRVIMVLYENIDSESKLVSDSAGRESVSWDTSLPLNTGLQVRLHKKVPYFFTRFFRHPTVVNKIRRSPDFHDANGEIPVDLQ